MIGLLLRLYPAAWRARYGDEYAAVLASRSLGPFDVADVLLAAIDAHLHVRGRRTARHSPWGSMMSSRLGGGAALIGGFLLTIAVAWSILDPADSDLGGPLMLLSFAALLVGLVGLSAFQARQHPRLIWAAFAIPAAGIVVAGCGALYGALMGDADLVAGFGGWEFFILGLFGLLIGSSLFGLATWRTRSLSRAGAALLVAASIAAVLGLLSSMYGGLPGDLIMVGAIVGYSLGWIALGWSALGAGRPVAVSAA